MTRVLVVDDSAFNLKLVSATLAPAGYEIVTVSGGAEALSRVESIQPNLIILDVMMPDLNGYEVCRQLRRNRATAQLPILMLTANESIEERINGFEAGADDYMIKPFDAAELQARAKALLRRFAPHQREAAAVSRNGKTIGVYSLRGGVGVSTIATNLAVGLSQLWGQPTALVDMALVNGQSALMLNLPLRNSWASLANAELGEIDATMLEAVLLTHASATRVLASPPRPEQSELISASKVEHTLRLLKESFEYVVLDLPHDFSDTTLAALDQADQVLLVLAPELASVRAITTTLDVFEHLNYGRDQFSMVLNNTFERGALARRDIETALKQTMGLVLPFAADVVVGAINRGVPLVSESANRSIGAALEDYAFLLSKESQRKERPVKPSEAWLRVAQRLQHRRHSHAS